MKNDYVNLLFFPNETFHFVCFYAFLHFSGIELPFGVHIILSWCIIE